MKWSQQSHAVAQLGNLSGEKWEKCHFHFQLIKLPPLFSYFSCHKASTASVGGQWVHNWPAGNVYLLMMLHKIHITCLMMLHDVPGCFENAHKVCCDNSFLLQPIDKKCCFYIFSQTALPWAAISWRWERVKRRQETVNCLKQRRFLLWELWTTNTIYQPHCNAMHWWFTYRS